MVVCIGGHPGTMTTQLITATDLSPRNLLLCIPGIGSWTVNDVYRRFGEPVKVPTTLEHFTVSTNREHAFLPSYRVEAIAYVDLLDHCLTEDCAIKIVDFGQSIHYAAGQRMDESFTTTLPIAAPEVLFEAEQTLGPAIDVWAFACTLHNILGDGQLFSSGFFPGRDFLLSQWVRFLGKFPDKWWSTWEGRSKNFEEDGSYKVDPDDPDDQAQCSLRDCLMGMRVGYDFNHSEFGSRELDTIEVLFRGMLKYRAKERIEAEEIVRLMPIAWEKGVFP